MAAELTKPCKGCPYARATAPGDLRGQPVERFIAQAMGPFLLPCHRGSGGDNTAPDGGWDVRLSAQQCAGAAIYRANTGAEKLLPPALQRLPKDGTLVFATPAEYLAHHRGLPLRTAQDVMASPAAVRWIAAELDAAKPVPK